MAAKNILKRKLEGKCHVYIPAIKQEETQNLLLDRFLEAAFGGSASNLVMQVLGILMLATRKFTSVTRYFLAVTSSLFMLICPGESPYGNRISKAHNPFAGKCIYRITAKTA